MPVSYTHLGFVNATKAGIDYNATLETSSIKWETLLGSQEKANKMLKDIEKFAATTPFEKMGVEAMATQLHNAGFEGQSLFDLSLIHIYLKLLLKKLMKLKRKMNLNIVGST